MLDLTDDEWSAFAEVVLPTLKKEWVEEWVRRRAESNA